MTSDNDRMQTHYSGCWRDPRHHACAVAHAERLREIVAFYLVSHAPGTRWEGPCSCPLCEQARKEIER